MLNVIKLLKVCEKFFCYFSSLSFHVNRSVSDLDISQRALSVVIELTLLKLRSHKLINKIICLFYGALNLLWSYSARIFSLILIHYLCNSLILSL